MLVCVKLIGQFDCIYKPGRQGPLLGADRRRLQMGRNHQYRDWAGISEVKIGSADTTDLRKTPPFQSADRHSKIGKKIGKIYLTDQNIIVLSYRWANR